MSERDGSEHAVDDEMTLCMGLPVTEAPKCWGLAKKFGFGLFDYLCETVLT